MTAYEALLSDGDGARRGGWSAVARNLDTVPADIDPMVATRVADDRQGSITVVMVGKLGPKFRRVEYLSGPPAPPWSPDRPHLLRSSGWFDGWHWIDGRMVEIANRMHE